MYDLAEKNGKYLCNIDYGDINELCETLDVDAYWFDQFFKYDDGIEDYYFDYDPPFRRML